MCDATVRCTRVLDSVAVRTELPPLLNYQHHAATLWNMLQCKLMSNLLGCLLFPDEAGVIAHFLDRHGRAIWHILEAIVGGIVQALADLVFPGVIRDFIVCLRMQRGAVQSHLCVTPESAGDQIGRSNAYRTIPDVQFLLCVCHI